MKKFFLFALIILGFTMLCIFFTEKTDVLGLRNTPFHISFAEQGKMLSLSWNRLPYPCFYHVEVLGETTGLVKGEPKYRLVHQDFTFNNAFDAQEDVFPTYYRLTAYGMFGQLTNASTPVRNPRYPYPPHPLPIFHYTQEKPASLVPYLVWHAVPGAVCYEAEILSAPPEEENGTALSRIVHLYSTQKIYTNGFQVDLAPYAKQPTTLYWRVRALDFDHQPIGVFSQAEPIYVDPAQPVPDKPLINDFDQAPDFRQPLYPVYQWIPMHNAQRYEVELMTTPTPRAQENGTEPSPQRAWAHAATDSFACYDEYARPYAGGYYWRVRAIDDKGNTIGHYSDTAEYIVAQPPARVPCAVFGDSITHGGGALSFSPADLAYSYITYLDFPALNLGKSGDTAQTTMERFDQDVLPFRPLNLLILTGSNSLRDASISAESIIGSLEEIRKKCEQNDIRPIFLTLMPLNPVNISKAFHSETDPKWAEKLAQVNSYLRSQRYHIDIEPYFYDAGHTVMDASLAIDGLHPDIRGKMLMAEIINQHAALLRK